MQEVGNLILEWRNGLGNCLFQYCFGRLISEKYDLQLKYLDQNGRSCYKNPIEYGLEIGGKIQPCSIDPLHAVDIFRISSTYGKFEKFFKLDQDKIKKMNLLLGYPSYINGLIEDYRIYTPHIEKINKWFPKSETINSEDLVFHIRLGDNWNTPQATNGGVIPQEYYLECETRVSYNKLFIVTDDPSDPYHNSFKHLDPIFLTNEGAPEDTFIEEFKYLNKNNVNHCIRDFNFLRSFDNIVVGNSTFSWWAAFLGQNKNVFTYEPWQRGHVNLGQTNLENWTNIKLENRREDFLSL